MAITSLPPTSARRSRRRIVVGGLVILAVFAGSAVVIWRPWRSREKAVHPPVVELTGADPLVAKAIAKARAAVEAEPKSGAAWGKLGMVLLVHDYLSESLICFARAEQLSPTDPHWPYYQGQILMREHPDAAIASLQRAATLSWRDSGPQLRLAEALLSLDRLDEAETAFRRVSTSEGQHTRAILGLGLIARRRGDWSGCLPLLEAAALNPLSRRSALAALAEAHQQLGHAEIATQMQLEVSRLGKDEPWVDAFVAEVLDLQAGTRPRLSQVNHLLSRKQIPEAIALSREILRDDPTSDLAHLALGRALMQANDFRAAEKEMAETISLYPDLIDAYLMRIGALMNLNRYDEAITCCRAAIALNSSHALAHQSLARCLHKKGDDPGAKAAYRDAIRCRPDLATSHVELAELFLSEGNTDQALKHLRDALRLNDDENLKKRIAEIQNK